MIKFIHRLFVPHCVECRDEREHECKSCETLRAQLEIANYEKKELLNRLLNPVTESSYINPVISPDTLQKKAIPWRVRRQMMEAEDRQRAIAISQAAKPAVDNGIAELEKELDLEDKEVSNG